MIFILQDNVLSVCVGYYSTVKTNHPDPIDTESIKYDIVFKSLLSRPQLNLFGITIPNVDSNKYLDFNDPVIIETESDTSHDESIAKDPLSNDCKIVLRKMQHQFMVECQDISTRGQNVLGCPQNYDGHIFFQD